MQDLIESAEDWFHDCELEEMSEEEDEEEQSDSDVVHGKLNEATKTHQAVTEVGAVSPAGMCIPSGTHLSPNDQKLLVAVQYSDPNSSWNPCGELTALGG